LGVVSPYRPNSKKESATRREEKDFRGVYKSQQVAAVHLGWGQAPSLETENDIRVHSMGAIANTWGILRVLLGSS